MCGDAVEAGAVGDDGRVFAELGGEEVAVVEDVAGRAVAGYYRRGLVAGGCVLLAEGLRGGDVV